MAPAPNIRAFIFSNLVFLPVAAVIKIQHAPGIAFGLIGEHCESCVMEHEARSAVVDMQWDAQNGIHGHIQYPAMGGYQVISLWPIKDMLNGPAGPQVYFPPAFTRFPKTRVWRYEIRSRARQAGFFWCQTRQPAIVDFHPVRIQFHRYVQRMAD